ncbi:MAG: hypothetical protein JF625_27175 [Inquilinus limosus]|uniref:Uncharacterized protein n=1 Tax=Inquilinus limosus TaxID=171674 RepID=A0A952FPC1_9PROT|nr:hypothetical protein [Inquilinus limosus]
MLGELMVFAATEAVVFVATALVFSSPDLADDDDEAVPFETGVDAAGPRSGPASQPSEA